jgi:hypothetical protein
LSAAELQKQRQDGIDRMRQRMGSTMPGVQRQTGGSTGGRGGGS